MMPQRRTASRIRLGIAIGRDVAVVRALSGISSLGEWRLPLEGDAAPDDGWPALDAAFAQLWGILPRHARVLAWVVLLPPLVQLRRIELPRLRAAERRRVLSRDAARHFVGAREEYVADGAPIPGSDAVLAAAVPARVADAVLRAAEQAGLQVRSIQAAPWSWAASLGRARRESVCTLMAPSDRAMSVVSLTRGAIADVRRLRRDDASLEAAAGMVVEIADGATVAATFAERAQGPELLPESAMVARDAAMRRLGWKIGIAAAALVVLSAVMELASPGHQLALVRAERAALRPNVARALASRDSATLLETQLSLVSAEVEKAPRWTGVIANLTRAVPQNAWLTSFVAAGDSVALVGQAADAADVFEALRRTPGVVGIRADGPIRREMSSGSDRMPVERFSVTVKLSRAQ